MVERLRLLQLDAASEQQPRHRDGLLRQALVGAESHLIRRELVVARVALVVEGGHVAARVLQRVVGVALRRRPLLHFVAAITLRL